MEAKRFIFDLDGTIMTSDPQLERDYFRSIYGDFGDEFVDQIPKLLDVYENTFPRYDIKMLSDYLTSKTNFKVTPKVVRDWVLILAGVPDTKEEDIEKVLEYFKRKDYSLAVLTNWFRDTQIPRLKKAGVLEYFDEIYTGDDFLKPQKRAFLTALGDFQPQEAVFIGDSVNRDYIGPRACGIHSILYDKKDIHHKTLVKVKRLDELMEKY